MLFPNQKACEQILEILAHFTRKERDLIFQVVAENLPLPQVVRPQQTNAVRNWLEQQSRGMLLTFEQSDVEKMIFGNPVARGDASEIRAILRFLGCERTGRTSWSYQSRGEGAAA